MIKNTHKILALVVAIATLSHGAGLRAEEETVKVGVLHSLAGTMAISETSLRDVLIFAFDEINAKGGVLGKKITPIVADGASNWPLFGEKATQLLEQDKVAVVFGCWTSVSRKSVLPVFEKNNGLLFYPVQYEGEEESPNVCYTAEAVNQQATPAVDYLLEQGYKKFYLLGSAYVYPQPTNLVLLQYLLSKGVALEMIAVGAYTTYLVQNLFGAGIHLSPFGLFSVHIPGLNAGGALYGTYFLFALPLSFLTAAGVGLLLERGNHSIPLQAPAGKSSRDVGRLARSSANPQAHLRRQ